MKQRLLNTIMAAWVGPKRLNWFNQLDWKEAIALYQQPELTYPDYYRLQNFHGIDGGYLNSIAAITYDPVTQIASPPSERWLRKRLLAAVSGQPQRILDLGCGTGSSTLMLKQTFPEAAVTGLDLSPYMLVMADYKAQLAALEIDWYHGLAESTPWESASFDLVTMSFLFHEMPPSVSQAVLAESLRLLKPGGQVLVLDGSQRSLRYLGLLIDLFREPYSRVYATGCIQDWLKHIGYKAIQADHVGFIHQLTTAYAKSS
ncbi:MAG: methyltransferase domain-containing protein [Cyanobacteria bacterium P01_F01_bin.150]